MSEVLDHAHFSLLPFLGFETCHALGKTCKQAAHLIGTYPHLSLLEGTSKVLHVAKEKRNKFFHLGDFDLCIDDFVVFKDGRIIVYDGRTCYVVDKNKEIRPLRGRLIKQFYIPLGIQGISLDQDMLCIAHGYSLKWYSICDYGNSVQFIENAPTLLHDDQELEWRIFRGCSNQEFYLFDHVLFSAQTNQHIVKTRDAKVFCSFSKGFIFCGKQVEIVYTEENTRKELNIQLNKVKQVQASKCGSIIYVLEHDSLVYIVRGQHKRIALRAKCIYLQTHLYYITLDNKLYILH
jgi:hypothetical protein